ncbi:hypothetical protein M9Y10_019165 [Tritrichomonas musculus]|uniref:Uncharacterized protein n=1 Tax=Tritrichomonas musculus TaxID=1915356 RepID=A0ABR2HJS9_9EUKA
MKTNSGTTDSHTDFEAATLTYALIREINEPIAEEYRKNAFPHKQAKENSQTIYSSLPKDFFPKLIQNSLPKTSYPSLIHNFGKFTPIRSKVQERRSKLIYERLKRIVLTHRLVGHTRSAHSLLLDPFGILFFTGSEDTNIKCWHIPSFSLVCTFKGHEDAICGLQISPDRKLLASFAGKDDKFVRLWSLVDGAAVAVLPCSEGGFITSITFSPCNRYLAIASSNGTIRFIHITSLIPILAHAHSRISPDGKIPNQVNIGQLLFADGDFSHFNEVDPQAFIKSPPRSEKNVTLKTQVNSVKFSPGGNFAIAALENGNVIILSMTSTRRWIISAFEKDAADGAIFLKNNFHMIITWSQRGGEIKTWSFNENKIRNLHSFTVRANSKRSHLVALSVSCDESLLFACTSQSIFAWKIDDNKPLRHNDDSTTLAGCVGVEAHPKLPTVFMAITKNQITFWDASINSQKELINTLIIPVETPRIHMAMWAPDGLSVIATDAGGNTGGGVFIFRVAEEPECRTVPLFFPSDFTPSEWVPEKGQIEEGNRMPTHLQPRTTLANADQTLFTENYKPLELNESSIALKQIYPPFLKYSWLSEELWLRRLDKNAGMSNESQNVKKSPGRPGRKPKNHQDDIGNSLSGNIGDDLDSDSDVSGKESDSDDRNVSDNDSDSMSRNNHSDQD